MAKRSDRKRRKLEGDSGKTTSQRLCRNIDPENLPDLTLPKPSSNDGTIDPETLGNSLYVLTLQHAKLVLDEAENGYLGSDGTTEYYRKKAIVFFTSKTLKTFQAIYCLWLHGFEEDAFILNRTLFEIALQVLYIEQNPEVRAAQCVEHEKTMSYGQYQDLENLVKSDPEHTATSLVDKLKLEPDAALWKRQYEEYKSKYGIAPDKRVPRNWWGGNLFDLVKELIANKVDNEFVDEEYRLSYNIESGLVHSSMMWHRDYVTFYGNSFKLSYLPRKLDKISVLVHSGRRLMRIVLALNNSFGLSYTSRIEEAIRDLDEVGHLGD